MQPLLRTVRATGTVIPEPQAEHRGGAVGRAVRKADRARHLGVPDLVAGQVFEAIASAKPHLNHRGQRSVNALATRTPGRSAGSVLQSVQTMSRLPPVLDLYDVPRSAPSEEPRRPIMHRAQVPQERVVADPRSCTRNRHVRVRFAQTHRRNARPGSPMTEALKGVAGRCTRAGNLAERCLDIGAVLDPFIAQSGRWDGLRMSWRPMLTAALALW